MVNQKIVVVLLILAIVFSVISIILTMSYTPASTSGPTVEVVSSTEDYAGGTQRGNINLVVNPPAEGGGA